MPHSAIVSAFEYCNGMRTEGKSNVRLTVESRGTFAIKQQMTYPLPLPTIIFHLILHIPLGVFTSVVLSICSLAT